MAQNVSTPSSLEIHLLGPFKITIDGKPVEESCWQGRKAKLLVKLLAIQNHHQLHREQVMEFLWPELDQHSAINNLNKTIHLARRALEPGLIAGSDSHFILTQEHQVRLRSPGELRIDVDEFEQHAAAALRSTDIAVYQAALELYQGDLLSEDLYEDWPLARREQLRALHEKLLTKLAQLFVVRGEYEQSIEQYKKIVSCNSVNEDAHRQLVWLYAVTGNRHQALLQYKQCCEVLRTELAVEPEPATIELYQQILDGTIQPLAKSQPENGQARNPMFEDPAKATQAMVAADSSESGVDEQDGLGQSIVAAADNKQPGRDGRWALSPQPMGPSILHWTEARWTRRFRSWTVISGALVLTALIGLSAYSLLERSRPITSLAVLPLVTSADDPNMGYLADGITESIINNLAQLPTLRVMARSTVFHYKGREVDPKQIGRELNVRAVLTGNLIQRGDTLVIRTELVDTTDGAALWGEQYNRRLSDILMVQEEIAWAISDSLRLSLSAEERKALAKRYTDSPEAYQYYLKGRYFWSKRTLEGKTKAIEYYQQAIEKDPSYGLAYSGLADCYLMIFDEPPSEAITKARAAAMKALEIDERLAEPHASLAKIKENYDWDFPGAEREYRRAIELNPNYATAHHWYGYHLALMGRKNEAVAELQRARELDLLSPIINLSVGWPFYYARDYDQAITEFRKALEMSPNFVSGHFALGWAYEQKAMYQDAIAEFQKGIDLSQPDTDSISLLGHAYAVSGRRGEAQNILNRLDVLSRRRYVSSYDIAAIYEGLGEKDRAFDWLEKSYREHAQDLVALKVDPWFDGLRSEPRFVDLLRRVGLAP